MALCCYVYVVVLAIILFTFGVRSWLLSLFQWFWQLFYLLLGPLVHFGFCHYFGVLSGARYSSDSVHSARLQGEERQAQEGFGFES